MRGAVDIAKILVIEDSPDLLSLLERLLCSHGWEVRSACDGNAGLARALEYRPDLAIIDIGLPGRDGLEVTAELRRKRLYIPVLMLTARGSVADRITGLDAGADDYLGKPFDAEELVARVRALLRRGAFRSRAEMLRVGELILDPLTREAWRRDRELGLTQREFSLLEYLMRHPGRAVSRQAIAEEVWRQTSVDLEATNIVDVYVAYLRKKLDANGEAPMLRTIRGVGYELLPVSDHGAPGSRRRATMQR
jgi:DNA-binding response OmpR family regulator